MPFHLVRPDDTAAVEKYTQLRNECNDVDDPGQPPLLPELLASDITYGWDLEPSQRFLYTPDDEQEPVGVLGIQMPRRDNLHLVGAALAVRPTLRQRGHGTAMVREVIRRAEEAGRTHVWIGCAEDDALAVAFLTAHGFRYGSHDARRKQVVADLDQAELDRLYAVAAEAAADYTLERMLAPVSDDVLAQLVEVTAAINDAPMGDLTFEDEKFDLQRLRDFETAAQGKRERLYRVVARHTASGEAGGHTVVMVQPRQPHYAWQYDTAVARGHRGHKLGLLVKLEMMRWLAEVEPQIETVETWNQADNSFMINVNEAIGYRLDRVFAEYELVLPSAQMSDAVPTEMVGAQA